MPQTASGTPTGIVGLRRKGRTQGSYTSGPCGCGSLSEGEMSVWSKDDNVTLGELIEHLKTLP